MPRKLLLQWQLERLKQAKYIEEVIVATTVNTKDDPIVNLREEKTVNVFKGMKSGDLVKLICAG